MCIRATNILIETEPNTDKDVFSYSREPQQCDYNSHYEQIHYKNIIRVKRKLFYYESFFNYSTFPVFIS